MKILLIAPHFAPLATPQSLRWYYLCRELAIQGIQIHVLTGQVRPAPSQWQPTPAGIEVSRVWSVGMSGVLERWCARRRRAAPGSSTRGHNASPRRLVRLKQSMAKRLGEWLATREFPGECARWIRPAQRQIDCMMAAVRPDVVICSHQPAAALIVGRCANRHGVPWVADLGDPVCAAYSKPKWQAELLALEASVCQDADAIVVTTRATEELLAARHGDCFDTRKVHVVSQGYDVAQRVSARTARGALRLYYSGRVYGFRDPRPLIDAVSSLSDVRLDMRCPDPPRWLLQIARGATHVTLLPAASHQQVVVEQASADVLVDIGNAHSEQTPGKFFEYLAAGRPVLHLAASFPDQSAEDLRRWRRGWVCQNDVPSIAGVLAQLVELKSHAALDAGLVLDDSLVQAHGWGALAQAYARIVRQRIKSHE